MWNYCVHPLNNNACNLEFYLHKSMRIKSITGSVPITYQFDVEQPCSFPFTPDAGTLKNKAYSASGR